ncbi:MAG: septal ring lytic transglycosylase RlpA family protein [Candidatus Uhrbacteria bacterium]
MASEIIGETVLSTQFDAETIVKGYTLESHDQMMRLGIRPETLNVSTRVDVKTLAPEIMSDTYPEDKVLLGNVYLFDIIEKDSYDGSDFFFLEIKYPDQSDALSIYKTRKRIYFYNAVSDQWEELPSTDHPDLNSVRALIHLPYARLAVFEDPEAMPEGFASWYQYKDCNCAASPDYPKGSYLVVTRADDPERSVTVQVNDYGPDRSIHPDRVIDLDLVAFKQLASLGVGLIEVTVKFLQ